MERINLDNFPKRTPDLKIYSPPEPTEEEKKEQLRISLGLSSWNHTFENFKQVKGTEIAFNLFRDLASDKTNWKMLLYCGHVGSGKTHLCEATVIELNSEGKFCRVKTMAGIMGILKQAIRGELITSGGLKTSYDELLARYCYTPYLIIDDAGMGGSGSEWEWGQLEEIINYRYQENIAGNKLLTIITTNKDLTELPPRIVSRFQDKEVGRIAINEAPDYRKIKR